MEKFSNRSESFFREIRKIDIYPAESSSYIHNFNGIFPNIDDILYTFDVVPEDYERKISTKTSDGNYLYDVDLGFPLLNISIENREKLYEYFNKKEFAVVLVSNTEKMLLGNEREPLSIEVIDGIKDNNSGTDQVNISITGKTIIPPKIKEII